ncbi:MAG: DNA polymerase I [Rhodospirillales bacterium]|nr:DNA polymerase I [Rhodospirillales bacterium]
MSDSAAPRHLYLVDGSGYIFRAYYAIPRRSTSGGVPTNAVFGFTNMLIKLLRDSECDGLAVIFDHSSTSFRNEIYDAYKAQRPEPPADLRPQFAMVREATRAFGLPCLEMEGFEADDIIATLSRRAREAGWDVTIISSDKDMMQLVGGSVAMLDPLKQRQIGPAEVVEKFGVAPAKVVDVQALAGDSVDNVPGVPGIGIKTAAQLIEAYGDLETLLEKAGEIKQPMRRQNLRTYAEQARISKRLVTLKDDVPLDDRLESFVLKEPDNDALRVFLERYEFRSVLARLAERWNGGAAEAAVEPMAAEPSYSLVQDLEALKPWIAGAQDLGVVGVDTETTGLDALQVDLVGISLALPGGKACYIPLQHGKLAPDGGTLDLTTEMPPQIPLADALAALKPLLEDPGVLKVGQNIKYDMLVFARQGIAVAPIDDTMLLSYVLEGGLHGHGMDELSELHLGHKPIPFGEVAGRGKKQVTFDRVPLDKALAYAAEDADITLKLHEVMKPRLAAAKVTTVYETLERPLVPILAAMEICGIKVDRAKLKQLSGDFEARLAILEREIHDLAGRPFAIGSPKQLGEIMFDEMGIDSTAVKKTKTGAYATGADVLESLAALGHDLPAKVLDWRQLAKLKSTYTDALRQRINPETGRVHTSYSQAVASTGRLSSSDPNLQNIPVRTETGRLIRGAFVAKAGCKLLSVDYSQIELRLTAAMAGVPALQEAFAQGQDIHAKTASQVFDVPLEEMDGETRRKAKAINFGIIYGISSYGLANNLRIPQAEAKAYIQAYFARYPEIETYMEIVKAAAREQSYVETLFGRKIHTPAIKDKNPARRSFAERAAINAPIQGTAADIIKRAMIRIPPALEAAGLSAQLLLQVHDELIFEVAEAELEETSVLVCKVMETAAAPAVALSVALVADMGIGRSWAEAH